MLQSQKETSKFVPQCDIKMKPCKKYYLSFLYFSVQSEKRKLELYSLLSNYYTDVKFNIILANNFKMLFF